MKKFTHPSFTIPLLAVGCLGDLTGENWVGLKIENCYSSGDTAYGYDVNCDFEPLPYTDKYDDSYYYFQYFIEIEGKMASLMFVYVAFEDDYIYGNCYSYVLDLKKEGTTYKLNFFDGEEALVCEKEGSELICSDLDIILTEGKNKFEYDELLARIYSEYN